MPYDIGNIFKYHPANENQLKRYEALRAEARAMAAKIMLACPDSRERSLAFTKLEESIMWANAAIARNE